MRIGTRNALEEGIIKKAFCPSFGQESKGKN
jgi:hypothetical protein